MEWVTHNDLAHVEGLTEQQTAQANLLISFLIAGAVYDRQDDGWPRDKQQQEAIKLAARLQASHLAGEASGENGEIRVGSVALPALPGGSSGRDLLVTGGIARDVFTVLHAAGLGWRVV